MPDFISLRRTCHTLHNVSTKFVLSIVRSIIPRDTVCYKAALRSAKMECPDEEHLRIYERVYNNAENAMLLANLCAMSYDESASPTGEVFVNDDLVSFPSTHPEVYDEQLASKRLRPHELERLLHCWYFLKTYVQSDRESGLRLELDKEVTAMSWVQCEVMRWLMRFLSSDLCIKDAVQLGILNSDESDRDYGCFLLYDYDVESPLATTWQDAIKDMNMKLEWTYQMTNGPFDWDNAERHSGTVWREVETKSGYLISRYGKNEHNTGRI